ncbi:MAG: ABC transporter ATP-binding protein [Bacillati bacterium ANGP1]|uniref:ABC transporter ATP-binding protein n=1 Tax=Candidatus Segetimicrobium genomatis TaxID=2569760 RepID=A0A537K247_9BACT|nr:MAG: ABC transporter ATP-binding protein [Terrabacteria group bacterium ANGP1]
MTSPTEAPRGALLIQGLSVTIPKPAGEIRVLEDVSLDVPAGRAVALVGGSGAGKSMTACAVLKLFPVPAKITAGKILLDGTDLVPLPEREMQAYRGRRIAMIFQEPGSALDPVMSVGDQVMEGIVAHLGRRGARERAADALVRVGLDPALLRRYPHELSGGQRQRVLVAAAIAPGPELLIADEPTAALDVTVQAQILDLLGRLQRDLGMSLLLITHDLGVVAQTCDLVHVMRAGRIVESAETRQLFAAPQHPYTRTLVTGARRLGLWAE